MEQNTLVLGTSGSGKSLTLKQWAIQDIYDNKGLIFFDFDGEEVDDLLLHIPPERVIDTALFDVSDREFVTGFNVFDNVDPDDRPRTALSFVSAIKAITGYDSNTPILASYTYNAARLVLDNNYSLLELFYCLKKPGLRKEMLKHCEDGTIAEFWTDFETRPPIEQRQDTSSSRSNIEPFITDVNLRNVIGQRQSGFQIKYILSDRKILLIKLPRHILGSPKTRLLGLLFLTAIHSAAFHNKHPFTVYIDNGQELVSSTLLQLLTELRKQQLFTVFTIQQLAQLKDFPLFNAAEQIVSFNTGIEDSERLRKTFLIGESSHLQLSDLDILEAYVKNGLNVHQTTFTPEVWPTFPTAPNLIKARNTFAKPRQSIERQINKYIKGLK